MQTDTTIEPVNRMTAITTPKPTMREMRLNKGYTAALKPHLELIMATIARYEVGGGHRINWTGIFQREPHLRDALLVGPGPEPAQYKRLNQFVYRYVQGKTYGKRGQARVATPSLTATGRVHGTMTKALDAHRDEVLAQVPQFTNKQGIQWKALFKANPELAQAVGFGQRPKDAGAVGFWFKDRKLAGVRVPKPSAGTLRAPATVAHEVQSCVCSKCGHDMTAELTANRVIKQLASLGLSPAQIANALEKTAVVLSRLGAQS